jgi:hypothetical protein
MNKEKYLTLDQAKLVKGIGFGFGAWSGNIHTTDTTQAKYFHKKPKGYGLVDWKETDILFVSGYDNWITEYPFCNIWTYAWTQYETIDWLREKMGVQLFLDYTFNDGVFYYGVKWCKSNGDYGEIWKDNDGDTPDGCETPEKAYSLAFDEIFSKGFL